MDNEDLYDSDLEDLILTGKKKQIVCFDCIEQFKQSENELDEISGFIHNSNVAHYIIFNPGKDEKHI